MARNKDDETKEKDEEKAKSKPSKSVEDRKKAVKQKKVGRFAGLILLAVTVLIGFLMWVSGEVNNPSERQERDGQRQLRDAREDDGLIIIE